MIKIKKFVCNMIEENTYILWDETSECVLIDCGAYYQEERDAIVHFIKENNLKPVHLLATHAHLDHNFGINTINEVFGLQPERKRCSSARNAKRTGANAVRNAT